MRRNRKPLVFATAIAAVLATVTGVLLATAPSGILSGTVLARSAFLDPVDIKIKVGHGDEGGNIHVRRAQDTVMQQIVIAPGGHTGWHSHPGPAVALVKSGALTLFSSDDRTCAGRTYFANQAFVDSGQGHVHLARNPSLTENAEVWVTYFDVTYFDVPPGASPRQDAAAPGNCSF
jgi:hypothetical protein